MSPLSAPSGLRARSHLHPPHAVPCNTAESPSVTSSQSYLLRLTTKKSYPEAALRQVRKGLPAQPAGGKLRRSESQLPPVSSSFALLQLSPINNSNGRLRPSSSSTPGSQRRCSKWERFSASGIMGAAPLPGTGAVAAGILLAAAACNDPFFQLGLAVAIPTVAGAISGAKFRPDSWYFELEKPWWDPPAPIFGLAWGILYPVMGLASWLVWAQGGFRKQAIPLGVYALQLLLNLMWPAAFFGKKNMRLALLDIVALFTTLLVTTLLFQTVNPLAGRIMSVYLAWVAYATALNYSLLKRNQA